MTTERLHFRRDIMRLCLVPHLRGYHRRLSIAGGMADGHRYFRLEVPKRRLGAINPHGVIARHLWRVRTLEAWEEIVRKENRKRRSVSSLDLGFHHGDYTHLVPVPLQYLDEARRHGEKLRRRHIKSTKGGRHAAAR